MTITGQYMMPGQLVSLIDGRHMTITWFVLIMGGVGLLVLLGTVLIAERLLRSP